MKNKLSVIFWVMILIAAGGNIFAQEGTGPVSLLIQPRFFDIERLENLKEESFADFLLDINERDIFSSPGNGLPKKEAIAPREEVTLPKLKLFYRGQIEIGDEKIAVIETVFEGVKKSYFLKSGESAEGFRIVDIQKEFVLIYSEEGGETKLPCSKNSGGNR